MENLGLQETKDQLNGIDTKLVELFEKRMELYGQVAGFKAGTGKAVYDGQWEEQRLAVVATMTHGEFNRKGVHELFSQVMTINRRLQYHLLTEHGKGSDTEFTMVDELKREGARIAHQGVEGAYSHRAVLQHFGGNTDVYHVPVFEDAMIEVEKGRADYGVLPIEDLLAEAVIDNYDNLLKHDIYIATETKVVVDYALLDLPKTSLEDTRRVYSHPRGLIQCSEYLGAHRQWSQISMEGTAGAAKKVLGRRKVSQAAAANPMAGALYDLKVLEALISNSKDNTTRFIIATRKSVYREDAGKIGICFEGLHKDDSLYNMLRNFIYNDVNILMIESRPIEGCSWEYRSFVNVEDSLGDPIIRNALLGIPEEAISMKTLGNYQEGRKVTDVKDLVIYRNLGHQELFRDIAHLIEYAQRGQEPDGASCGGRLTELAVKYGFEGSPWHCFLTFCLANNENAYITTCEIARPAGGFLDELARKDCRVFKALFNYDIRNLGPSGLWALMEDCKPARRDSRAFNRRVRNRVINLAVQLEESADAGEFQDRVVDFCREFDAGKFGLNKAFRITEGEEGQLVIIDPITNVEHIYFEDMVGYKLQKQKLIENTEAFAEGKEANNVFLFGDAGTSKSSSVKAVPSGYYDRGLRIIEVYKHQFKVLSDVLERIKDRNYKLIIYVDDLSFKDYELEYKHLKVILEGEPSKRPGDVLTYAASNRRHLIHEKFSDKRELDDEFHNNDMVQGKLSLAARSGVTVCYGSPGKRQFETVVKTLTDRHGLDMPEQELFAGASKWELSHGGLSRRTVA